MMWHRLLLGVLLSFGLGVAFAEINVQIEPAKVLAGESFQMIITLDDSQSNAIPDLSPLQKNFHIIRTERSMHYTIMNGQTRSSSQWIILLETKKTGLLPIPAIKIGAAYSPKTQVEITDSGLKTSHDASQDDASDEVMLKTELSTKTPFIGQQVLYSVKLYSRGQFLDAQYEPPKVENSLMMQLGDAVRYQMHENGHNYTVEEQKYALFPQKSGELTIKGPIFNAIMQDVIARRIERSAKDATMKVKPVPKSFVNKIWLPAKSVILSEKYNKEQDELTQGSTITRVISLQATALPAQLLPELKFKNTPQFSVYPEKPQIKNAIRQQDIVGTTSLKLTYVLNQSGQITIPSLNVSWFNTVSKKRESAQLPERTIMVRAALDNVKNKMKKPFIAPSGVAQTSEKNIERPQNAQETKARQSPLAWSLVVFLAIAWLLTFLWGWFRVPQSRQHNQREVLARLQRACTENNPVAAKDALLDWASIQWPLTDFLNLNQVMQKLDDSEFKRLANQLSKALYGSDNKRLWKGADLWAWVASHHPKKRKKKTRDTSLPPINPK